MSNQELLNLYQNILKEWNEILYSYENMEDKDFIYMKKNFPYQYIDKGEYIVIPYQHIKVFIYNYQGVAKLEQPFGIKIAKQTKYHMTIQNIENMIAELKHLYH